MTCLDFLISFLVKSSRLRTNGSRLETTMSLSREGFHSIPDLSSCGKLSSMFLYRTKERITCHVTAYRRSEDDSLEPASFVLTVRCETPILKQIGLIYWFLNTGQRSFNSFPLKTVKTVKIKFKPKFHYRRPYK